MWNCKDIHFYKILFFRSFLDQLINILRDKTSIKHVLVQIPQIN
jgi:hypothetical protein